ncbi:MAG: hypothetical protein EHM23_18075 [Acidobacteria bacterium]|nr:MAG: hypothetical protein EHM23_18075 [Acidobacteriota bacterium]
MWRLKPAAVVLALLLIPVAFGLAADVPTEKQRVKALTGNLVCTCGCANIIVANCDCGQAAEMTKEVAAFVRAGKADAEIYQAFEKKYGPAVLGAPKLEGFNVLAWVLPFVGLGLGAVIVVVVIRKLHPRTTQEPEAELTPPEIDEKYRRLLDEELSE